MKLYVYVLEGRDWVVENSYVKLQLGKSKAKTRVLKNTKNPVWNEEFAFRIHSLDDDELLVSVYHHHDQAGGFFNNASGDFVGRVVIPVCSIATEENQNLPPTWFSLENEESIQSTKKECGKILLTLSLHERGQDISNAHLLCLQPSVRSGNSEEWEGARSPSQDYNSSRSPRKMMKAIAGHFEKLFNKHEDSSNKDDSSDLSATLSDYSDSAEEPIATTSFEESMETTKSMDDGSQMPENLQGGVLIDQTYLVAPKDLNEFLFAPDSQFRKDLASLQGTTDVHEGTWTWKSESMPCLTRIVTYTKAATKLVKAVKATEEQTFIKANGKEFATFVSVNTPDVPYGGTFRVELLYKIMCGAKVEGDESSRLVVSWGIKFLQSTMMKGMIEAGARQGLKESFDQFAGLLGQSFKTVKQSDMLDKDQALAMLQNEHQSDWELAVEYFWNFTVISTIFIVLYVVVHILLCEPKKVQGLEFNGLELPQSFGQLITCGIMFFNLERVYVMALHFVQARLRRGNDHGVKAQGEGWVLTVALIEGTNLASLDSSGLSDPYVVLTCNGKTRTSSVKLQTLDPQWNEILEFDAVEEPPSTLEIEVFDFDGPFGQPASLGHADISFVRHTSTELADIWVPLEGKLAQSFQSKLHLRIFLDNNNGVETIKEYLTKIEKEAGKKLNVKSPHRNSTFQKLFSLPPEEFLISDFSCSLKRKLPLQGRLFLSARTVGFHANLFGHKTKFFFLWEDVEDIQVLPPSLASVGSPILVMVLHKGRGVDARHGAKSQDEEGRLRFYFHSFVSFNSASRTIMALWRTRTLRPDQKADAGEEQQEQDGDGLTEDLASYVVIEDAKMSKIFSAELPFPVEAMMEIFGGGSFEHKVMSRFGCLNYTTATWEAVTTPNMLERRLSYKFNRRVSSFGGGVTCTQQKSPVTNGKGWIVNEVMSLHDVPFGDHFRVQLRYQGEDSKTGWCKCEVYIGVMWLKNTKFEQRITRNILDRFTHRVKELFELVEREILLATSGRETPT